MNNNENLDWLSQSFKDSNIHSLKKSLSKSISITDILGRQFTLKVQH